MMRRVIACAFGVGIVSGIACAEEDECTPGSEACPCFSGECLNGLVCLSGYCVDPDWTPPGGSGEASTAGADESGGDFDNVAACDALVDAFDCGMLDLGMFIDCDIYADLACDISDYFDCVRDDVECVDGMVDPAQLGDCAALAQCG